MKIVRINGGFGNALFQIALALYLKEKHPQIVKLDMLGLDSEYKKKIECFLSFLDIKLSLCTYNERLKRSGILSRGQPKQKEMRVLTELFKRRIYSEKIWGDIPPLTAEYYSGYFQNNYFVEKYRGLFTIALERMASKYGFNSKEPGNMSFIHIRGGDYLTPTALAVHGQLDSNYYDLAISKIGGKFDVFTNDQEWALRRLKNKCSLKIVTYEQRMEYPDIQELYMMSRYNSGVIANSTFSLWAANLGNIENKRIVYPSKWFADKELQSNFCKLEPRNWETL